MKKRLITISILFSAMIMLLSGILYWQSKKEDTRDVLLQQIIAVNELEQLARQGEQDLIAEKSAALQASIRSLNSRDEGETSCLVLGGICILYIAVSFCYLYRSILRPFDKMKSFAREIARGNLDIPLNYERSNYFGDFTWAFDCMRREILKSRSCEKEAVENNKTVIATLSHDIKTPIASIRAYAEGLEANMDRSAEKRQKYISVIMKKCDEVSALTNDLFLHSISDLDKLKISVETFELCAFLDEIFRDLATEREDILLTLPDRELFVSADRNRLSQVCENLVNNARKYAKTQINVTLHIGEEDASLSFRDYGGGIPDEDMPFIFSKFYRGKNAGEEPGSGLGLYIVKYILEKMQGRVVLQNHADGLEAIVILPLLRTS